MSEEAKGPQWMRELAVPSGASQSTVLSQAIGGKRGLIDSSLPVLVFVIAYTVTDNNVRESVIAALIGGGLVAVLRLLRKQSLQQVLAGFLGVAVSAWLASRSGKAEDFFLPGLLINVGYGSAMLISILVGHPLIGHLVAMLGGPASWRKDPLIKRRFALATWLWVGVFGLRVAIQTPLYLLGAVEALGVTRIILGLPLYLLAVWLTWQVVRPAIHRQ